MNMVEALAGKLGALYRLGARGTGMYYETPVSSPDVSWVMDWARTNRKSGAAPFMGLQRMIQAARNAPNAGEREKLAKDAQETASRMRKSLEARR